jgi:hypothetical protein
MQFMFKLLEDSIKKQLDDLVLETSTEQVTMSLDNEEDGDGYNMIADLLRQEQQNCLPRFDRDVKRRELEETLRSDIRNDLEQYLAYCSNHSKCVDKLLDLYPTELLTKEKEKVLGKAGVNLSKKKATAKPVATVCSVNGNVEDGTQQEISGSEAAVIEIKKETSEDKVFTYHKKELLQPIYCGKRFDVLMWWRRFGSQTFRRMAILHLLCCANQHTMVSTSEFLVFANFVTHHFVKI